MGKEYAFPAAALSQHLAIVGKTGSGKTSTGKKVIEQVVAEGSRVCVLDPIKSDWWGVKASADGKRPGLPFTVLGGPHGHVPLHEGSGAAIADLVARGELPLSVLDMADFEPGGQLRFFVDFAPRLLQRIRGVLYLVWEEAHLFAPKERSGMAQENMAIHWAKTLATAGRSKGIRLVVATQRTQALHNAVLGSCDTLIAHRLTAPADIEPVRKWLVSNVKKDLAKTIESDLSKLQTGTAWLCSGEAQVIERIAVPPIATFDNSATPTDDSEEVRVRGYEVDHDALRALLGEAVAEAEANDPKKLRVELEQLKTELATAQAQPRGLSEDEVADIVADRVATCERDLRLTILDRVHAVGATIGSVRTVLEEAHAETSRVMDYLGSEDLGIPLSVPTTQNGGTTPSRLARPLPETTVSRSQAGSSRRDEPRKDPVKTREIPGKSGSARPKPAKTGSVDLDAYERKVLDTMASLAAMGVHEPTREVVAVWADKSYTSSTWEGKVGSLARRGLITTGSGVLKLTTEGTREGSPEFVAHSMAEFHAAWRRMLERRHPKLCAMLDELLEAHPQPIARDELARRTNQSATSSTTEGNFGALSSLGITKNVRGAGVGLTDLLFPAGFRRGR